MCHKHAEELFCQWKGLKHGVLAELKEPDLICKTVVLMVLMLVHIETNILLHLADIQ